MAGQSSLPQLAGVLFCVLLGLYSLYQGLERSPDKTSPPIALASSTIASYDEPREHSTPSFESTIVTAYFDIPSKRTKDVYLQWIPNMMKLQDAMVIFTSPDMVETIRKLREPHAADRTLIVPVDFNEISILDFDDKFWEQQYAQDPQGGKRLHIVHGWQLYKLWLMKPLLVKEAIRRNPFRSSLFVWCDIGQFRNNGEDWSNKRMVVHAEVVPSNQMLFLSTTLYYSRPRKPVGSPWFKRNGHFVAGGSFAGRIQAWQEYWSVYQQTIRGYVERGLGVYDDQPILLSACLQRSQLCRFVTPLSRLGNTHNDNADTFHAFQGGKLLSEYPGSGGFFSFKYLLYHGGADLDLWYPGRDGAAEEKPLMTPEEMQQHGLQLIDSWEGEAQAIANASNNKSVR